MIPCSRKISSKWMDTFQINIPDGYSDKCNKGEFKTPQALMDHLNTFGDLNKSNGFLHKSMATYLQSSQSSSLAILLYI